MVPFYATAVFTTCKPLQEYIVTGDGSPSKPRAMESRTEISYGKQEVSCE